MAEGQRRAAGMAALVWGITLGFFTLAFAYGDVSGSQVTAPGDRTVVTILALCHAAGGVAAAFLLKGLLGRDGLAGWVLAIVGAVLITLLGNLLGGAFSALIGTLFGTGGLVVDIIRIAIGALTVPFAIADNPPLILVWLVALVAGHLLVKRRRHVDLT
ncbi:MAG: hypothetical protein AAGF74_05005 [Pseudomonadota bacterium]